MPSNRCRFLRGGGTEARFNRSIKSVFISYAVEGGARARKFATPHPLKWLAKPATIQFPFRERSLGEMWFPFDAIKRRTFRMLALSSEHSLRKPKPTGERKLAQRIAEQRKIPDFLIPLKADGSELDWLTTMVFYISFTRCSLLPIRKRHLLVAAWPFVRKFDLIFAG